jgi:hypothetical protein
MHKMSQVSKNEIITHYIYIIRDGIEIDSYAPSMGISLIILNKYAMSLISGFCSS